MTDEISIPPVIYQPKAFFQNRPTEALVVEIKGFIQRTGTPYLWPGHTHSKPPANSTIVYVGEFDLPPSHRAEDRWAPCPCCSPTHPKYYKDGKIAWFPDEAVIRIMGPQCFAKINATGHSEALDQFRKEEQRKKDIAYLLANVGLIGEAIKAIEHALPIAKAVEIVREILGDRIDSVLHTSPPLWGHLRDGMLKVTERRTEHVKLANGEEFSREVELTVPYGALPGYTMLHPGRKPLVQKLSYALAALKALAEAGVPSADVKSLADDDRKQIAKILERAVKKANEALKGIEEVRPFVSVTAIATLSGWGRHSGCPIALYISLEENYLLIGRTEYEHQRLPIPKEFFGTLIQLPRLGQTNVAA